MKSMNESPKIYHISQTKSHTVTSHTKSLYMIFNTHLWESFKKNKGRCSAFSFEVNMGGQIFYFQQILQEICVTRKFDRLCFLTIHI